jgi:hypothetical protein
VRGRPELFDVQIEEADVKQIDDLVPEDQQGRPPLFFDAEK